MESRRPDAYGVVPERRTGRRGNFMWSNIKTLLAAALIIAGIATFAYQGITFATRGSTDGHSTPGDRRGDLARRGHRLVSDGHARLQARGHTKRAQNGELR
jgi:hypothetical protein